ncbi:rRNA biogenesis protein rrp5 [Alkaliphilus peptidifermentans]|uniref:rRNA biogenesis protein rrp5 n=1 Tax=Alkaliphilus peptidifermentans DSM 18978 TaxID=1120976 RepID=A0A1G5EJ05_9FIRM|nr:rRNA biogenesis protein rrp5 [Alkaliphilus peptidifermentans]SCY26418.1 hypothetical protein SAMN03080606_01161 [Alkaliphilus peptidifermentans DSM 18978]
MSKIKRALEVVSDLRSLADSIEELVGALEGNATETKVEKTGEQEMKKEARKLPKKLPTLEEVRAKLAVLSQNGKQVQVKELITEFGAKKLSDIPTERYPELLEKVEVL